VCPNARSDCVEHANERELLRKQNELLTHATLCVMDRELAELDEQLEAYATTTHDVHQVGPTEGPLIVPAHPLLLVGCEVSCISSESHRMIAAVRRRRASRRPRAALSRDDPAAVAAGPLPQR
jgi:hypothetical protein